MTPHDPMLDLITRYRRQCRLYNASPEDLDDDALDRLYAETVEPLWRELAYATPPATTEAGAREALRLCVEEMRHSTGGFQRALTTAALAYFDRVQE